MSEIITLSRINKTYDGKRFVLKDLSFSMKAGEISTIRGLSGCGKSTMLNIVGLLDNFSEGEFFFDKVKIKPNQLNKYYKLRANDIGFVFQAYHLIEAISVKDNILMPFLYNRSVCDRHTLNRLDSILMKLNVFDLKDKNASVLSGGERQRIAIARAIIKNPKLIIADEPTGNLDDINAKLVIKAFQDISMQGTAIIVVTHNKHLSFGNGPTYMLEEGALHPC